MRCCLINAAWGSKSSVSFAPPLGLAYIAGVLENEGHEVKIIDRVAMYYGNSHISLGLTDEATKREISDFAPQFIGLGATTTQFQDMQHVARLIRTLAGASNYVIIAGGFHPTAEPELVLEKCPEIDVICRGEGEFAMLDIVSGRNWEDIEGLTFNKNGKLYSTPNRHPISNIDILPFPARDLLNMQFYLQPDRSINSGLPLRTLTMLTSRGCHYNCKFCASRLVFKQVRLHSSGYVLDEIRAIVEKYRPEVVSFADDMFLSDRDRVEKICYALIESRLNKKFKWTCSARADSVDEKILKLMREANCVYTIYGLESGSQRMLDNMNKRTTVDQNKKAVYLANRARILVNSAFIVNVPGETEEDVEATLEFIRSNKIYMTNLNSLMPLPGTPYYDELARTDKFRFIDTSKLWKQAGMLPEDSDAMRELLIYSNIPKEKFLELWDKGWEILEYKNNINYILVNWFRTPLVCLKKLIFLGAIIILGGKHSPIYQAIRKIYHTVIDAVRGLTAE